MTMVKMLPGRPFCYSNLIKNQKFVPESARPDPILKIYFNKAA